MALKTAKPLKLIRGKTVKEAVWCYDADQEGTVNLTIDFTDGSSFAISVTPAALKGEVQFFHNEGDENPLEATL